MSWKQRTRMTHSCSFISVWPCSLPSLSYFSMPELNTFLVRRKFNATSVLLNSPTIYCFIVHGSFCIAFSIFLLSFALDTLESSYAMVLLPLACEPLEYLRGRFTNEEKQQDRVGCIIMLMYFLLNHFSYVPTDLMTSRLRYSFDTL